MQFVIAGAGEVGLGIAKTLLARGHQVVLIEKNSEVVRTLNDTLAANIIEGDLAFYSTLRKIDVSNCDAFLAMTQNDAANIMACHTAKLLGVKQTVCRLSLDFQQETQLFNYPAHFSLDHILTTQYSCAFAIAKILRSSHRVILEQFSHGAVELRALKVGSKSKLIGEKLIDLAISTDLRIGLIERGNTYFIPHRDTKIQADDVLTLSGTHEAIHEFSRAINPESEFTNVTIFSAGPTCQSLLKLLQNPRFKIKVIENSLQLCQKIADEFPNVTVIHGDGTHLPLLQEEQINFSDYFVACSNDDEKNIIACLQSKKAGAKHTILCVNKEDYTLVCDSLSKQLEVDHIVTSQACIWKDLQPILFPQKIFTIETLGEENPIEIVEIEIPVGADIEGLSIDHLSLPEHCIFLILKHKFRIKVPAANDILLGGDCIIAAVQKDQREQLIRTLTEKNSLV